MLKNLSAIVLGTLLMWSAPAPCWADDYKPDLSLEADMVFIPAGQFLFGTDTTDTAGLGASMGIPKPLYQDEHPGQKPFLKGFYIDRHEVTQHRYQNFLEALPTHPEYKIMIEKVGQYQPPKGWEQTRFPEGMEDHPVIWVSWYDAENFCDWAGKRLPTEKEWERAARGTEGRAYPWGNTFERSHANLPVKLGSKAPIAKVGAFPAGATPLGVQDMAGNVWEWTTGDYAPYSGNSFEYEDFNKEFKVMRGLSVSDIGHFPGDSYTQVLKEFARAGYRQYADPSQSASDVGFRCVSSTEPKGFQDASTAPNEKTSAPTGDSLADSEADTSAINPFEAESKLPKSGFMVMMIISLLAGLFSFMSPCTLPILPAYFAITAQTSRSRMTLNSLFFFCGLATLFVIMGASASFLGGLLRDYLDSMIRWGGGFIFIFGAMTLIGKGFSGAEFKSAPAATLAGYFLFGATFAMGWTPCVGPILTGILILAASDKTVFEGMLLLFFYAVGLGSPLILIASACSHLSKDGLFWRVLRGKAWDIKLGNRTFLLHTTNLFSGLLLMFLGVALAFGYLTYFNSLIPLDLQIWFAGFEEKLLHWFQ